MTQQEFINDITGGIPVELPPLQPYDTSVSHAPKRKDILNEEEKRLALRNALRYFPKQLHAESICIGIVRLMQCMPVR